MITLTQARKIKSLAEDMRDKVRKASRITLPLSGRDATLHRQSVKALERFETYVNGLVK